MLKFQERFAGSISACFIGSAACIGLNALLAARLHVRSGRRAPPEPQQRSRPKFVAATAGASLFLMTSACATFVLIASHRQAAAVDAPATISIDDLQRRIDTKSLPVQEVSDYM